MALLQRSIQVRYDLRVHFTQAVFDPANRLLAEVLALGPGGASNNLVVVLDKGLALAQPGIAAAIEHFFSANSGGPRLACAPLLVEGGEAGKNSAGSVAEIHSLIDRHHLDRHSFVVGVGGGALLDVVGFAAATAHRGVRHVRIPTTTLCQCDSGVGVKNGINAFGKKNFIGSFAPPFAVINDFDLLASLSSRDKRGGYAEAVKVALVRDPAFFAEIETGAAALCAFETAAMQSLIRRCAELHLDHIATSGDPFEQGSARPLDFGHWSAHKLEQLSAFRLRHGEAVAIGIAVDTLYSQRMGWLDSVAAERTLQLLERLGFTLLADELFQTDAHGKLPVLGGLEEFREHLGGELTITFLRGIGRGFEAHQVDIPRMMEAIEELRQRPNRRASTPRP